MVTLIFCLVAMYVAAVRFSPFPYWKTYWVLWQTLLQNNTPGIGLKPRLRQAGFLIKYLVMSPLWTFLWFLDNQLYPAHRTIQVRPVFIVGQPRSGTTFLHRTLAADDRNFTAIRHLEWRYPFICLQRMLEQTGIARRLAQKNYWTNTRDGQVAARMHPNKLSDWEEDGIFFEECFLHHFFVFFRFPYPDLLTYLDNFPGLPEPVQKKILQIHRQVIQKVLYLRGNDTACYLSKEVTSHNKFPGLRYLYPDAKFIFCLRPSNDFMSSLISLVEFSTKSKTGVDPRTLTDWEPAFLDRMQKDSRLLVRLCLETPDDQRAVLVFDRLSRDPDQAVRNVYDRFGLTLSSSYKAFLEKLNQDQKNRNRGYDYEQKQYPGFESFDRFVKQMSSTCCQPNGGMNNESRSHCRRSEKTIEAATARSPQLYEKPGI